MRIQRLGRKIGRGGNETVIVRQWSENSSMERRHGQNRIGVSEEDIKCLGVENWSGVVKDRDRCRSLTTEGITLG